ncbi:hypothetical protein [Saccharothrix australiensis]|uniref:SAV-6107-like HEPN domain-containing protein n=1 Tax=Saccharothrix australiensis TaxID=2072 RepID=A0A495VLH1_9PSEU|nr:hypothetical protein [Saccharothrix australiensis]RKT49293.1 hypothetical protein C8E97_6789 [Saccharothrix australiensis]
MTGPEHYQRAERFARDAAQATDAAEESVLLRHAQVHATLAAAAATALAGDLSGPNAAEWAAVAAAPAEASYARRRQADRR